MSLPTGVKFLVDKQRIISQYTESLDPRFTGDERFKYRVGLWYKTSSENKSARKMVDHLNKHMRADLDYILCVLFGRKEQLLCKIEEATTIFWGISITSECFTQVRREAIEFMDIASELVNSIVKIQNRIDSAPWLTRHLRELLDDEHQDYDTRIMAADACIIEHEEFRRRFEILDEMQKNKAEKNEEKDTETDKMLAAGMDRLSIEESHGDSTTLGPDPNSDSASDPYSGSDSDSDSGRESHSDKNTTKALDPAAIEKDLREKALRVANHQLRMHGQRYGCLFTANPESKKSVNFESKQYMELKDFIVSAGTLNNISSDFLETERLTLSGVPRLMFHYMEGDSLINKTKTVGENCLIKHSSPLKHCTLAPS